jgi:hypothetical protein
MIVGGSINITQNRPWDVAIVSDNVGAVGNLVAKTYEWLYCGKSVIEASPGSGFLGYSSVKYVHLESKNQLTILGYCNYYGTPLEGELNIPESITEIGNTFGYNYWVGFRSGYLTRVTIGKNVELIVDDFNYHNLLERFDCYPLIAPTVVENYPFMNGNPTTLHIKPNATGYNVYPWNDKTIFKQIIRDL